MNIEKQTKFNKRKGTSGVSGQFYEIKLIMLFLLEAVRRKEQKKITSFYLASNIEEGQSFDDLVFAWQYQDVDGDEKSSVIFIQAKHKEKEEKKKNKISIDTLLSTSENADCILRKYISSFIKIQQQFSRSTDHPIFKNKLEHCEFIIYTNAEFDFEKSRRNVCKEFMEQEHFLNITKSKNYYYKLSNTEEVMSVLKASLDYEILTKALAQSIVSKSVDMNKPIITEYHNCLAQTILKKLNKREGALIETFFEDQYVEFRNATFKYLQQHKQFAVLTEDQLRHHLLENRIQLPEKFGATEEQDLELSLPQKFISDEDIKLFLSNLKIFTDQPNETVLTEIIKDRIKTIYRTEQSDTDIIYSNVEFKVRAWWKDADYYLTENNTFFQDTAKVSFYFDVKPPTELFTGRKRELGNLHRSIQRNKNKMTVISQMTTVSGLGGIGKTELARQYIVQYSECYDNNIIWVNAENDTNITGSFLRLAKDKLKISIKTMNEETKNIESVIEEVYNFFSNRRCLFVFDNVENCSNFIKMLPLYSLKPVDNRPYVLVTSRKREWEKGIEVIDLYELDVRDAVELVKKGLNIRNDLEDKEIEKLVSKLQYFPLAIRQAIAYIHDESITSEYTIADYLKEFDSNKKDLLNSVLFQGIDDSYTKTTYTTWKITINKISKEACGHTALKLLNVIAFISNEKIDREMFLNLPGIKEKQLKLSVRLLIKYSMINGEQKQSTLSVHRLVQEVTRLQVSEQNQVLDVIKESCLILRNYFPYGSRNMTDLTRKRRLLPHIEMLLYHTDNCFKTKDKLISIYLEHMLNLLCDGYFDFDLKNQKKVLERIIKINMEKHNLNTSQTVEAMISLSEANRMLGDYHGQKEVLERALKIQERPSSVDYIQTSRILTNLAFAYGNLSNLEQRKELLEKALTIQENHLGPDDYQIAIPLTNLGVAYGNLGYPEKQKELLERASKLIESYQGPDTAQLIESLLNLGGAYGNLGDPRKQIDLLERVFVADEKFYGSDHCELSKILTNIGLAYGRLGKPLKQIEVLERALKLKENSYGSDHYEVAEVLLDLSGAYSFLGDPKKQKELSEKALNIQERYYGVDHIVLVGSLNSLAHTYMILGDTINQKVSLDRILKIQNKHYGSNYNKADQNVTSLENLDHSYQEEGYLEPALEIQQKLYVSNNSKAVVTLINLSDSYGALGDYKKQKELLEQALQLQEQQFGADHFEVTSTLVLLSTAYWRLGDVKQQKHLLEQALKIQEQHYGPDHTDVAVTLTNLSISYGSLGEPQKQKELLERALNIQLKHFGPDHYQVAIIQVNLSIAYMMLGHPLKQKELLEKALIVFEDYYGPNHIDVSKILTNLGIAYGELGEPTKQKEFLEKALELSEKHYGSDHYEVGRILTNLSTAYGSLGDAERQKSLLERSLKLCEQHYGPDHYETSIVLFSLGFAHGNLGNPNKQKELQERALSIQQKHYGSDSVEVAKTLINLSVVYKNLDDFDGQIKILEQALVICEKHFGSNHIQLIVVLKLLSEAFASIDGHQKQQVCLERILSIQENLYGSDHLDLIEILMELCDFYKKLDVVHKQKDCLERVLVIQDKHCDSNDNNLIETLKALAETCKELGDSSREDQLLHRISQIATKNVKSVIAKNI